MKTKMAALVAALMMLGSISAHADQAKTAVANETDQGYMVNNYYVDTGADNTQILARDLAQLHAVPYKQGLTQLADSSTRPIWFYYVPMMCLHGDGGWICAKDLVVTVGDIGLIGRDFLDHGNITVIIANHQLILGQD